MLLSLILMAIVAAGGFSLTYLVEREAPFLWRTAAGTVIGSVVFGTSSFLFAMAAGLNIGVVVAALIITLLPILLITRGERRKEFQRDRARAKGKLQGASGAKALRFLYYAAFFLLFVFFFDRTMYETDQGIFTGGSNNLGDLPYHLGAILSFTEGANFPPQNPSFAGAKFSYPFIADLVTSCFAKLGANLRDAMLVQNVAWAFSLLVILERFVLKVVADRLASKLAPALLFFSGGLGFVWFVGDFNLQAKGLFEFLWSLPKDYTIGDDFRWGNSLVTLFMTQRSLLLGMPLTLIVFGGLWEIFVSDRSARGQEKHEASVLGFPQAALVLGLMAGSLPLVHLHSLAVLFVVTGFLFLLRLDRWKEWLTFGVGVCIIAIPQLIWSISGSATETTKFFEWHFGWDSRNTNVLWFWIKNTGLFFPLLGLGIYLLWTTVASQNAGQDNLAEQKAKSAVKSKTSEQTASFRPAAFLLFYIPFGLLFIASNIAKLAPWEWDNIKVLVYWYIGSIPLAAFAISWLWGKGTALKVIAGLSFLILIFSGSLDVWRTISGHVKTRVFEADAVKIAQRIKLSAPAEALFLNAPTYNSAIVLTGRRSVMRYPGHLASHGIDYGKREADVKLIYSGGPQAEELMRTYGIEYVLISPEERSTMKANEVFFSRFPVYAEVGQYKVYKVK